MQGWRLDDVEALTVEEYNDLVEWIEEIHGAPHGAREE